MKEFKIDKGAIKPLAKKVNPISTDSRAFPLVMSKVRCPNYFILKPGKSGFVEEVNRLAKNFSEDTCKEFGLKRTKFKKDANGNKIPKWDDYYQPVVSAAYAIEHIWDPNNWVCTHQCRGRCMEGKGTVLQNSVDRLRG